MLFNLLEDAAAASTTTNSSSQIMSYVLMGVLLIAIVVMFIISNKRNKKKQEEAQNLIDSVKPGNKVKTIGGICGIVVEVNNEDNTFVLETGSESVGKNYIKFDKQAIYQTDAVAETKATETKTTETKEVKAEAETKEEPAETKTDEKAE